MTRNGKKLKSMGQINPDPVLDRKCDRVWGPHSHRHTQATIQYPSLLRQEKKHLAIDCLHFLLTFKICRINLPSKSSTSIQQQHSTIDHTLMSDRVFYRKSPKTTFWRTRRTAIYRRRTPRPRLKETSRQLCPEWTFYHTVFIRDVWSGRRLHRLFSCYRIRKRFWTKWLGIGGSAIPFAPASATCWSGNVVILAMFNKGSQTLPRSCRWCFFRVAHNAI